MCCIRSIARRRCRFRSKLLGLPRSSNRPSNTTTTTTSTTSNGRRLLSRPAARRRDGLHRNRHLASPVADRARCRCQSSAVTSTGQCTTMSSIARRISSLQTNGQPSRDRRRTRSRAFRRISTAPAMRSSMNRRRRAAATSVASAARRSAAIAARQTRCWGSGSRRRQTALQYVDRSRFVSHSRVAVGCMTVSRRFPAYLTLLFRVLQTPNDQLSLSSSKSAASRQKSVADRTLEKSGDAERRRPPSQQRSEHSTPSAGISSSSSQTAASSAHATRSAVSTPCNNELQQQQQPARARSRRRRVNDDDDDDEPDDQNNDDNDNNNSIGNNGNPSTSSRRQSFSGDAKMSVAQQQSVNSSEAAASSLENYEHTRSSTSSSTTTTTTAAAAAVAASAADGHDRCMTPTSTVTTGTGSVRRASRSAIKPLYDAQRHFRRRSQQHDATLRSINLTDDVDNDDHDQPRVHANDEPPTSSSDASKPRSASRKINETLAALFVEQSESAPNSVGRTMQATTASTSTQGNSNSQSSGGGSSNSKRRNAALGMPTPSSKRRKGVSFTVDADADDQLDLDHDDSVTDTPGNVLFAVFFFAMRCNTNAAL
jgi:hypothetical protein